MCYFTYPGTKSINLVLLYSFSQEVHEIERLIFLYVRSQNLGIHIGFLILNPIFHSMKTCYVQGTFIYFILILKESLPPNTIKSLPLHLSLMTSRWNYANQKELKHFN